MKYVYGQISILFQTTFQIIYSFPTPSSLYFQEIFSIFSTAFPNFQQIELTFSSTLLESTYLVVSYDFLNFISALRVFQLLSSFAELFCSIKSQRQNIVLQFRKLLTFHQEIRNGNWKPKSNHLKLHLNTNLQSLLPFLSFNLVEIELQKF